MLYNKWRFHYFATSTFPHFSFGIFECYPTDVFEYFILYCCFRASFTIIHQHIHKHIYVTVIVKCLSNCVYTVHVISAPN